MDFLIPDWLIGALPILNYVLNEIIIRVGAGWSSEDKENLVYAVSIAIVAGLILFGAAPLPEGAPTVPEGGSIADLAPYIIAVGGYAVLVLGWAWKGAVALHDTLSALGRRFGGAAA